MDTNAMLDVTIGMAMLYLLLSLFCTTINELIASVFKLRARNLRRGLQDLIDDEHLRNAFEGTPIMRSIKKVSGGAGPSYLPSARFVGAVLDAIGKQGNLSEAKLFQDIEGALKSLPESDVKNNLLGFAHDAANDVDAFRKSTAAWFDDMMDRAAGVYKRRIQALSFAIALLLTVGLNVDSVAVARTLWSDVELRSRLVLAATDIVARAGDTDKIADVDNIAADLRPFPIGWGDSKAGVSIQTFVGWLLTALAVSLGAPFWFDLLSKFTKMRGSGTVPAKSAAKT